MAPLLAPLPEVRVAVEKRAEAPEGESRMRLGIARGVPLAYAGGEDRVCRWRSEGSVDVCGGKEPGADEDATGRCRFVGKAGQLLNNMNPGMG